MRFFKNYLTKIGKLLVFIEFSFVFFSSPKNFFHIFAFISKKALPLPPQIF